MIFEKPYKQYEGKLLVEVLLFPQRKIFIIRLIPKLGKAQKGLNKPVDRIGFMTLEYDRHKRVLFQERWFTAGEDVDWVRQIEFTHEHEKEVIRGSFSIPEDKL